jgi:hypothetical protein
MPRKVQKDKNSDFNQMELPLELGKGEEVLQRARLVAASKQGAWYELYLVGIPHGYLIEKHSGVSNSPSRQKETWFRRNLVDAENKFFKIIKDKLNPERKSPRKYQIDESVPGSENSRI